MADTADTNALQNAANQKALEAIINAAQAVKKAENAQAASPTAPTTIVPPLFGTDISGMNLTQQQAGRYIAAKRAFYQRAQVNMPLLGYAPTPLKDDLSNPFPFGFPPPVGTAADPGDVPWNNDACSVIYDENTGLYWTWALYRIHADQLMQWSSNGWASSVSLDGQHFAQVNGLGVDGSTVNSTQYVSGGGIILDRDNVNGLGAGACLFLIGMGDGNWDGQDLGATMFLFCAAGGPWDKVKPVDIAVNKAPTCGDPRVVWDNQNQQYVVVARSDTVSYDVRLSFRTGPTLKQLKLNGLWIPSTVSALYQARTECPNLNFMIDEVTGERVAVLTYAIQSHSGGNEYDEGLAVDWNGALPDSTNVPKRLSYGSDQYGVTVNDPFQRDGSGGTTDGSPECWIHRWAWNWAYSRDKNGWNGGYSGNWAPSILKVRNGELYELPHPALYDSFGGTQLFRFPDGVSVASGTTGTSPAFLPLTLGRFWRARITAPVCAGVGAILLQFGSAQQTLNINIDCNKGKNIQVDRQHIGEVTYMNAAVPMPIEDVTKPIELFLYWDTCRLMIHNVTDGTSLGTVAFPSPGHTTVTGIDFAGTVFTGGMILEVGE